ncbi:MAG: Chitin synthase, class 5 [Thelocarpon superellum]|nr:MAG: Chitin synthase, class 5 [Thelocarpon superellum]
MLISLTVGKVDAGVAVLLTQDKRLIEFPSILLPPHITSGSIVDITVARNLTSEIESQAAFTSLQNDIFTTFGQRSPSPPTLRCRNATQTSVVLEWDPIDLATADLRSLSLYRNGSKAGTIPRPQETRSTKISGLAIDTEYTFHLVLRTSAGTYSSERLQVKTHKMTDLSGITVTPGVLPTPLRQSLEKAVQRIGAKMSDTVRIDTTHFVCTEGRGEQWEKAVEGNIPVVRPEWLEGCEREGRIVGVRGYYLNADPRLRQVGPSIAVQQGQQANHGPPTPHSATSGQASPRALSTPQPPMQSSEAVNEHAGANTSHPTLHNASTDGTSEDEDEEDEGDGGPPAPPPKDDPEPKSLGEEPKVRMHDRAYFEKRANGAPENAHDHDGRHEEDAEDEAEEDEAGEDEGEEQKGKKRDPAADGTSMVEVAL